MFFMVARDSSSTIGNPKELFPSVFPPLPPPLFPLPPPLPPIPCPLVRSSVMMILLKVSSSSGSSTNGERGEIPPSSSSGVSTSSIIIGPPVEGRKGSPPNSDSIDSEGESIIVSGSPETLGLGVWVGDEGDSCLTLEVDGLVKMELLAPARNLHLESLALCMSFLFLQVKLIVLFLIFQVTLGARREHTQETTRSITISFPSQCFLLGFLK